MNYGNLVGSGFELFTFTSYFVLRLLTFQESPRPPDGAAQAHAGEQRGGLEGRERGGADGDAAGADGVADAVRGGGPVDQRVGRPHLIEDVEIRVADQRLAVVAGPALRGAVEVQPARIHRVNLERVEHVSMGIERLPQGADGRVERMGGDDEAAAVAFEALEVGKAPDRGAFGGEVDEQDVLPLDRPLDPRQQQDPPFARLGLPRRRIEISIVERDRQHVIPERRRMVDQVGRGVRNLVQGVQVGMGMQLDLQHPGRNGRTPARPSRRARPERAKRVEGVANLSAGLIVSTNQNLAARVFVSSLNGPGDP